MLAKVMGSRPVAGVGGQSPLFFPRGFEEFDQATEGTTWDSPRLKISYPISLWVQAITALHDVGDKRVVAGGRAVAKHGDGAPARMSRANL